MFFIKCKYSNTVSGETLEEAIENFEYECREEFNLEDCEVYEAKRVNVKRGYFVVKESDA